MVVVTDDPVFNLARARNLGANAAVTPWLLFIDADVLVTDLQDWINHGLQAGKFYMTRNYGTDLTGTFFCMRQIYSQIAGYDEAFRGWGGEDDDMYYRLAKAGQQKQTYPDSIFVSINHDEDERFAEYPDSNKTKQWMVNQWYRNIKYDLMAVRGGDLSLAERIYIRKLATEAALNAIGDEVIIPTELFVNLGENMDLIRLNAWALDRRLIYTVRSRAQ